MSGQEVSRRFHAELVHPAVVAAVGESPYAAAMLGEGSDVLGYDDDTSTDHGFGPRVQLVIPGNADPGPLLAVLARLPTTFAGYPVLYGNTAAGNGWTEGVPSVCTPEALFSSRLGFNPASGVGLADWLRAPTQILATLTRGPSFTTRPGCSAKAGPHCAGIPTTSGDLCWPLDGSGSTRRNPSSVEPAGLETTSVHAS